MAPPATDSHHQGERKLGHEQTLPCGKASGPQPSRAFGSCWPQQSLQAKTPTPPLPQRCCRVRGSAG